MLVPAFHNRVGTGHAYCRHPLNAENGLSSNSLFAASKTEQAENNQPQKYGKAIILMMTATILEPTKG